MLQTVRNGSENVDVALLQAFMNKQGATPRLTVDGVFGRLTERALRSYQTAQTGLTSNGVADSATWRTFPYMVRETRHNVTLRAQTGTMGCWSAAAGMITNAQMSHGSGGAQTGPAGGMSLTIANMQTFISGLGWQFRTNQSSPPATSIESAMARGPVWVVFQGRAFAHAVVFSKILTDGTNDGTAIEVMDPWPVGRGTKYLTGYAGGAITLRSDAGRPQAMVAHIASP